MISKHPSLAIIVTVIWTMWAANGSLLAKSEDIIAEGAKPVKLAGGFKFTEGPAIAPNGDVYFTDIPNSRVHKWDVKTKKVSLFMEKSGGANGLFFFQRG
jgi:gluconolactonase